MAEIIPVNNTGDRRIQCLLGSNLLTIRTYWNPTVPGWYMDITDSFGVQLVAGAALVPEVNVLAYDLTLTRLYGQFRVFTTGGGQNATPESLGTVAQLWWFAPGEWEAVESVERINPILPFDVRAMYTPAPPAPENLYLDGSWMLDGTYYLNGMKVPAEEII